MRTSIVTIIACAALGGCAEGNSEIQPEALQGKWRLVGSEGNPLPEACQSVTLDIGPTRIQSKSGTLDITTMYEVFDDDGNMRIRQTPLSHNGGDNCQGIPASYVLEHFVEEMDADLIDGRLRLYLPSRASGEYTEFVREPGGSNS